MNHATAIDNLDIRGHDLMQHCEKVFTRCIDPTTMQFFTSAPDMVNHIERMFSLNSALGMNVPVSLTWSADHTTAHGLMELDRKVQRDIDPPTSKDWGNRYQKGMMRWCSNLTLAVNRDPSKRAADQFTCLIDGQHRTDVVDRLGKNDTPPVPMVLVFVPCVSKSDVVTYAGQLDQTKKRKPNDDGVIGHFPKIWGIQHPNRLFKLVSSVATSIFVQRYDYDLVLDPTYDPKDMMATHDYMTAIGPYLREFAEVVCHGKITGGKFGGASYPLLCMPQTLKSGGFSDKLIMENKAAISALILAFKGTTVDRKNATDIINGLCRETFRGNLTGNSPIKILYDYIDRNYHIDDTEARRPTEGNKAKTSYPRIFETGQGMRNQDRVFMATILVLDEMRAQASPSHNQGSRVPFTQAILVDQVRDWSYGRSSKIIECWKTPVQRMMGKRPLVFSSAKMWTDFNKYQLKYAIPSRITADIKAGVTLRNDNGQDDATNAITANLTMKQLADILQASGRDIESTTKIGLAENQATGYSFGKLRS